MSGEQPLVADEGGGGSTAGQDEPAEGPTTATTTTTGDDQATAEQAPSSAAVEESSSSPAPAVGEEVAAASPPPSQQQPQQHPPPSPLSGCYLLVVLPEPHTAQHKDLILNRLAKGFLSWDKDSCHVDLEKELQALVAQAPEGEEARNGERLIQYATENLVTEVLIYPQSNTLLQCIRNLLASFTKHRHIIHAGYTFGGNGSWILQDGTFSLADFLDAFSEHEVQRVLRAYENSVTVDIHCAGVGDWSTSRLSREICTKACRVRVNPDDVLTAGVPAITSFTNYIGQYLIAQTLDQLMEPSDVVGNIRFSHPTLYVFPGGQGDAALFGINGFNMLVDGGFARKACFWDFARHLDRLDAVLVTRVNNSNVGGMSSVLRKKKEMHVYPQIGHFFCNLVERRHSNSPDGDKDLDPLILDLIDIGQEMMVNLRHINLRPHPCYRDPEPINLYHKVGHGTLDMYVLSPSKDSREVREFIAKWNASDSKLFAGSHRKDSNSITFPIQSLVSICAMLVWQPANPEDTITRILFPGSTPQHKIFEGFERLKHLDFLKHPVCTAKSLSPSSSLMALKDKTTISKPKLSSIERETKRLAEIRRERREISDMKNIKKESNADDNLAKISAGKPTAPSQLKTEVKAKKVVENKKIESETRENKKIEKELKEIKRESRKIEKSERLESETKKTDAAKIETEKTAPAKDSKIQKTERKKDSKDVAGKNIIKSGKPESAVKPSVKTIEKKPKIPGEKKDAVKSSPTTPKKTINGSATRTEMSKTTVKSTMKIASKMSSTAPAKSAKDANNRMVVEQKNIELTSMTSSAVPTSKAPLKSKTSERKSISRRTKAMSPSKVRLPISPAKSTRSTPTASVKSEKDAVIRKVKGGTTDSSAVSTPSGIEPELAAKLMDKNLTEKSEDMSLDSIESKVLADLKEEREVVEEIEAVLQKAERIEEARKEERFEGDDEITAEATDKKDDDLTEEDITAEMDDAPKKMYRKESQELTEEDEYLIVEKEEIYTEDSVQSGDAEHKHHLDEAESEKRRISCEKKLQEEEFEPEEEQDDEEDKDFAEEKKDEIPEKQLVESTVETERKKSQQLSSEQKEQLKEEVEQIIAMAMETVQKIEEKDDSGKKDSEDITKEPSSLSPEKLDSLTKPDVMEQKEQVPEKMEESQERISTLESGATTTAPTLPEDERIPLDEIKEDVDEKHVVEEVKEKDIPVKPKDFVMESLPVTSKPEVKELIVKTSAQQGVSRDVVKTPDEVADLPVHEEVDPKLYRMYDVEKDKDTKTSTSLQEAKEQTPAPEKEKNGKGVLSFFGKVADKFEKGIDKLTKKTRRDSEKDTEDKSSKSSSPKELKPQEMISFEQKIKESKIENVEQATHVSPITTEVKTIEKLQDDLVKNVEEVEQVASRTLQNVTDSLQDSLEQLEDKVVEEKNKLGVLSKHEVKATLAEAAEKLVDITTELIDVDVKEPEKVEFSIPSNDDVDEGDDDSDGIVRDFKEAVRDVAEVLVGTAGIEIEKEKPKDVEEIVKKVAEVLKEDDFLPRDELSDANKQKSSDFKVHEEPCVKIIKEADITVYSPNKDTLLDKQDLMKICDDIMGDDDIIKREDIKTQETKIKTESAVDVMASGLEEVCIKETAKRDIRDENLENENIIVESEIGFDQKLAPGKAELVTVTPGSTPTSPKLAAEINLPELPTDYKNILNKETNLESIIEEFIITKKYKITSQALEYIVIVKNAPKEKILDIVQEIIVKYKIPYESVVDNLEIFDVKISNEDTSPKDVDKRKSVQLDQDLEISEKSETDTKEKYLDEAKEKYSGDISPAESVFSKSPTVSVDTIKDDKLRSPSEEKEASQKVLETTVKSPSLEKETESRKTSVITIESVDVGFEESHIAVEKSKSPSVEKDESKSKSPTPEKEADKEDKSKSPSIEKEVEKKSESRKASVIGAESRKASVMATETVDADITEDKSKSPSPEKEAEKEDKSKSPSTEKEVGKKAESRKASVIETESVLADVAVEKAKSPSPEKEARKEDKSKSPSVEKEVEKKAESRKASVIASEAGDAGIAVEKSKSPTPEKEAEKEDKSKSPSVEKEVEKTTESRKASVIGTETVHTDIAVEKSKSPSPEKEAKKEDKSKSPSVEKEVEKKAESRKASVIATEIVDADIAVEKAKSPSPEKEAEKEDKSKSPSVEKEVEKKAESRKASVITAEISDAGDTIGVIEKSKSPTPEKEASKEGKSKSPSVEKEVEKTAESRKASVIAVESRKASVITAEISGAGVTIGDTEKSKSPTPEKEAEKEDKSKSPSVEKEVEKPAESRKASVIETETVHADIAVEKAKSPSPEKESDKEDKSKSPSVEKEVEKKSESRKASVIETETVHTDIAVEKSKSPSPEKEAHKEDKSKSPSAEKEVEKKSESRKASVVATEAVDAGIAVEKSKSPSPEIEADKEDKSKSPSVEIEVEKTTESRKASVIGTETVHIDIAVEKSKSPSPEKEADKEDKSKSPSAEKEVEKKAESRKASVIAVESRKASVITAETVEADIAEDKSKSPSPEKEAEKEDKSKSPSVEKTAESRKASVIETETVHADIAVEKAKSPSPEKESDKEDKSKSPSVEKEVEKKSESRKASVIETETVHTDIAVEKSKSPSPEKEAHKEDKSKSPSAEKEVEKKSESRKSSVVATEAVDAGIAVEKSKSPTPEKEAEKEDKSKSPSVEKEVEKTTESRKASVIGTETVHTDIAVEKSKSPSPEKEADKEDKSKSPSAEKEVEKKAESRKASVIAVESRKASVITAETVEADIAEDKSKSPSPEKEAEKEDKSKSPSVEEEVEKRSESRKASVIASEAGDAGIAVEKSKSPSPEKEAEKEDKSKSPSVEKEAEKKSESRKASVIATETVHIDVVVEKFKSPSPEKEADKEEKSKSPSVEKEVEKKAESRKASVIATEIVDAGIAVEKSKSPSPEKEAEKEDKSKSPSIEKEVEKKSESRKASAIASEAIDSITLGDIGVEKSKSPSPEKATEKEDKSKSPSVEKENEIEAESRKASVITAEISDAGDTIGVIEKSKSPTPEKEASKEDKSKSPSVEKEVEKTAESRKASVIAVESRKASVITAEISGAGVTIGDTETFKSPTPEKEAEKEDKSKSPSVQKEVEEKSESRKASMIASEAVDSGVTLGDIAVEKSKSASPEKESDKEDKSKSPSVEKEVEDKSESRKASVIETEAVDADIAVEKSKSSSPEKEAEKKDKSKSPSVEKEVEKKAESRKASVIAVESRKASVITAEISDDVVTIGDVEKSKSLSPEKEAEKEDKSKSPSVEKEVEKKAESRKASVIATETVHTDVAVEKSKSPSPENEAKKEDKSKSPSVEKDVEKKSESRKASVFAAENIDIDIIVEKSKSPSPEKEAEKADKSKSPSVEKDVSRKASVVSVGATDTIVEKPVSPSPEAEADKDDKAKSPSVEKEVVEKIGSRKTSVAIMEDIGIVSVKRDSVTEISKLPSPEKVSEKEDKLKSPSFEKDSEKKLESRKTSMFAEETVESDIIEIADTQKSPSVEKETTKKVESRKTSVISVETIDIDAKSLTPEKETEKGSKSKSPSVEKEVEKKVESRKTSVISVDSVYVGSEKSDIAEKSKLPTPEKVAVKEEDKSKSPSVEKEVAQRAESPEKLISLEEKSIDVNAESNVKDAKSKSPSAEKDIQQAEGDCVTLLSFDTDSSKKEESSIKVTEKSISISSVDKITEADMLLQNFTDDRKASISSVGSHLEHKETDRSRSHSLLDSEKPSDKFDDSVTLMGVSKHVKDEKDDVYLFGEKFDDDSQDETFKDIVHQDPPSPKTTKAIQDHIINEYVNKKRIVTLQVINELSCIYKVDRYIIMKIVNEIVANFKTNREALLDFKEEDMEDYAQRMFDDQEKLIHYINDQFISKGRIINSTSVDEIAHANSVSRHLVVLVIENIITSQNLRRESIVDINYCMNLDPLEEELMKRKSFGEETFYIERKLSGFSSQDSEHGMGQSKQDTSHGEYESPFHKAFVGGMAEIRTTHITTLSGKSTPDSGPRDDIVDLTSENLSSKTTTITKVPAEFEGASIEQSSEELLLQTDDSHDVIRTESVTITKITQITSHSQKSEEILKESHEDYVISSEVPWERKASIGGKQISFGQATLQDVKSDLEDQLEQSASSLIRDFITDEKSHSRKSSTTEGSVGSRDIMFGGSTGKSTPDISSMHPSIMQSHLSSGRSTPDKRSTENRSRTATPEGFRSGDVIRTIITTTRTMSDDGDIITTTQEVTETTNEKGETVVLAEKTDVTVDERLPEGFISDIKSVDSQRAPSPGSDLADKEVDPTSPRSDLSSSHSRAATHVWGSSEERHTYSDEEPPSPPLSSSPYHSTVATKEDPATAKTTDDFSESAMTSSFYGELPSETGHYSSSMRKSPEMLSEQEEFTFRKFSVEKEYAGAQADKGSKKYVDEADLDFEKALEASGFSHELSKSEQQSKKGGGGASSKSGGDKEDPLAGWGSPLGLPSPKAPRKFNLRSPIQPCSSADLSPDSLNFDVINDWGEPMRLPTPAPTSNNNEVSNSNSNNKASPSTPKKDKKQAKKVMSENIKNKKRSESPLKYEKRMKDSKNKVQPVYVDLTYVSHHGNSFYTALEFFKKVRARYYVFSGTEPSREVYDALLEAKKTWEDKDLEVTMIPTYDTESLGYWVADNEEALAANHIDLSPSASRCTINLQDHETSCSAYRLEF